MKVEIGEVTELTLKEIYCKDCKHIEECKKEYGDYREDGDDYRAVSGSHFCRKSWDKFKCAKCCMEDMK